MPARIWAGSREGTRHGLSDQRIGDRPQRAHRGDGQHPVVSPRQARGFLAWPGHARPAHHVLRCGDVNLAHGRTWTAALRQQSGRRPAGRRTTLRVPRHRPAQRPGPGRPDPAGRGPAWIMPSARSAPSPARVQAVIPIPRNPPGSALMGSNVMPCSTARLWPPSSRVTQRGSPRPTIATHRASMPTASPCSPSPRTRLTPSRTRSSSPRRSFPRSATRIGSGPGCTRWPAMSATGGSAPRSAPPHSMRRRG